MANRTSNPEFYQRLERQKRKEDRDLCVAAVFHGLVGISDRVIRSGPAYAVAEARLFRRLSPDFKFEKPYGEIRSEIRQILTDLDLLTADGRFKHDGY